MKWRLFNFLIGFLVVSNGQDVLYKLLKYGKVHEEPFGVRQEHSFRKRTCLYKDLAPKVVNMFPCCLFSKSKRESYSD